MVIRIGVTGTDTGVGKTIVAGALAAFARVRGLRVAAMKPIETGVERGDPMSDAARLSAAAGENDPEERVCPIVLPEPLAPSLAARRAGGSIDLEQLDRALHALAEGRDVVVVEGAGGLLVPVTDGTRFDTLFRRWELDVIVVAGNRLGVLNHTLLTVQAARAAGLRLRCVVLNELAPERSSLAQRTNESALRELLPDTPVVPFPWVADPRDPGALAEAAEQSGIGTLLEVAQKV